MTNLTTSDKYALLDTTDILKDITGKTVDALGKTGSLLINTIDLGNSYLEESIELRNETKALRINVEKESIMAKAFNKHNMLMKDVDTEAYNKFKAEMSK